MTRLILPLLLLCSPIYAAEPPKLTILFLGDSAGHQPKTRFAILQPVFEKRNITLTYTDKLDDITAENLKKYDGLMIYANQAKGKPEHVKAIMDYVDSGKGFIPLHCASYCFTDSDDYIKLVGGQFRSHTTGTFRVNNVKADHAIMKGYGGFESFDETYVHTKHNEKDRVVLETRTDKTFDEPWTWVRTHGKGRIFYTAWGHDARTWNQPGFHNLVERGTRWACQQDPALAGDFKDTTEKSEGPVRMKPITGDKKDFEYVEAKIPFYAPKGGVGITKDPISKMQKPLTPEKSMTHYTMPEGFEMKLFASEEQMQGGKPICMTWDEKGRLFVAVTMDYPNELKASGEGRDRILMLEDTKGEGKADKVTVFADKLSIPTSLLASHGGLIVHQAPHTLFLKDTDGDGKADVKQTLFSGWSTNDTHAGPSNLRYGFDGWIYGCVGYAGFNGTVGGEPIQFRQGFYRFKLESENDKLKVTKLEFLRSTSNNTWGFCFNEQGEIFGSTANGCALVHMAIPNRYYEKVRGLNPGVLPQVNDSNRVYPVTDKVRQVDWHGGFTAAANCAIYTARTYPESYWNKVAFISEPTAHLTATMKIKPNGTEYTATHGWNLVASQDEWAAPIDAQVGPDGHVWVIDWYNFIVQHNPTPQGFRTGKGNAYESELRDKKYSRIYRLVYTKAKQEKFKPLFADKPVELVEALKSTNMFWRQHAQRLLTERAIVDESTLLELIKDYAANPTAASHALRVLTDIDDKMYEYNKNKRFGYIPSQSSIDVLHKVIEKAPLSFLPALICTLKHRPSQLLIERLTSSNDPKAQLAGLLATIDAKPGKESAGPLAKQLLSPQSLSDKNINDAFIIASAHQAEWFIGAIAASTDTFPDASRAIIQRIVYGVAAKGDANALAPHLDAIASMKDAGAREAIIWGFVDGWPAIKKATVDEKTEKAVANLMTKVSPTTKPKLFKLASQWNMKGFDAELKNIVTGLLTVVADDKAAVTDRVAAAKSAIEFQPADDTTAITIVNSINDKSSQELVTGILDALSNSTSKTASAGLVNKLATMSPATRASALAMILARPASTTAFLDAVEKGTLRFDMLNLEQRTSLTLNPDKALAERAKKLIALGGGLPDPDRQKVIEEFKDLLTKTGDAANGKKLFVTHCGKCHKHSGEGQQIGPDLTGFAVHPKEEILIHVLDPSRSVEGNYKAFTAKTIDGRIVIGLLASETKNTVELIDAENKRHTFQREDLDVFSESKKSLMPEGFEKTLKKNELGDVLEFLTLKGKYVPIPLDKVATIVSTKGMFISETADEQRLIFKDWKPKEFNGVPFVLVDPNGEKNKNVVMLYSPSGTIPAKMPKNVILPCNTAAKSIHFLSGVGGWSYPFSTAQTVSMVVRLHYTDGKTEDHELKNGVHFADYIRKVDVPESKFAFALRGQQIRYLSVEPKRKDPIKQIELVKGPDRSAPVVMAVTIETQ